MRAVVIYESMYGNTRQIAEAIGSGLSGAFDVTVVPVSHADPQTLADAGLVVAGGPTHVHGMSRASTRRSAVEAAGKPESGLKTEPGAAGTGLREWLGVLGRYQAKAAAFDTRMQGSALLTGRSSRQVARLLRAHGFDVAAPPESFLVTRQNALVPDEPERAREWATKLAESISPTRESRTSA